ncbi:MAG: hypothetical protein M3Z00_05930 [Actinomycetota bacterium]|nr:hypothetical protein [Actinomycetota bacterium]
MVRQLPDLTGISHALGPATDTPAHLQALTSRNKAALAAATDHLDVAIVPQATATAATPVVAGHVIELLLSGEVPNALTRTELLYFLGQVTEAAEGDINEPGVAGSRRLLPKILTVAESCENDSRPMVSAEAADVAESAIEVMDRLGIG